ncbi:unnamed protein product [Musa acuminata subsp. malaccensis]|uniref:(wild Malaysian banana) hypothetical protein n=1 Tax=Musa acuminata subsp. malaccensis TaxID=214687 RepID=A0A804L6E0_MUSAM|nr:PREDICTED: probable methyltransferase PMT26 [Musa acuminata subsp. malaccensis]CAG1864130.1 unnamed protein product [Musa acuminata subsp. malaccensis]
MAFRRSAMMDARRSSSHCSTVTLVAFIALCLVGVWMMTSSSTVVPIDMSSPESKSDMKQQVSETDRGPREDSSVDVIDEAATAAAATGRDANVDVKDSTTETRSESLDDQNVQDKAAENVVEKPQESEMDDNTRTTQTYSGENGSTEDSSQEATDSGQVKKADKKTYSDENGIAEGGEMVTDGKERSQEKSTEGNSEETKYGGQEKKADQKFDEMTDDGQSESSQQNSDETGKTEGGEMIREGQDKSTEENYQQITEKADSKFGEKFSEQNSDETKGDDNNGKEAAERPNEITAGSKAKDLISPEVFPDGAQSELLNETSTQNGAWSTQATESKKEKAVQAASKEHGTRNNWKLCNVSAGTDYIPCLDNEEAIKKLRSTKHYEHRERHCPDEAPACLLPLPEGYKRPIEWPNSRNKIWYHNVPHSQLAAVKGHQNWVKVSGEFLTFPGGGTQFIHGALHYIDFIQESMPDIAWGKKSRVVLDVGCGVASFGGFLFDRDVLTMSFAPKDEHEAQVQFALERGIPALSAVMGTKRLPFPGMVFDVIHCARCRVPWHIEGGMLLLELNRMLRPGGYFVWSATPVYQQIPEDVEIWEAMTALTQSMCWDMVNKTKDRINEVGMAIYRKPSDNECYAKRTEDSPPLCQGSDDPNAAWNIPLQACMHKLPVDPNVRGSQWPQQWPLRLDNVPYWLNSSQVGVYGRPAPEDFKADTELWKHIVSKSYMKGLGINWSAVRNVMDMRAVYGGFAAALQEANAWIMNIVSIDSPDTLPLIYERGLFGMYHDWCESFSTYPRSYDLLHADHLFSKIKKRCKLRAVIAEVDRILRPEGKLIVRDNSETIEEVESMAKSLKWEVRMTYSKENEGLLFVQKTMWRPKEVEASLPSLS